uniref:Arrestin C-terminal-like domain-containing protein n=2 Tax=Acrobeloides nanus TaxID=290746 RepID=A0A914C775_9BILA
MLAFTVIPHFDLNTIPYAASPIMKSESMNFGIVLFKHGRILVKVALPKSGYVPGETICTNIEINNTSSKEVERVEMFLMEVSNFEGKCSEVRRTQFGHLDHVAKAHKRRVVTKATQKISMLANKTSQCTMRLPIPPIVPSFNICRIIHVDYKLEIKVLVTDVNSSLCLDIPVLIGTYPVQTSLLLAPMPINIPPVPEYLTPPQPTALPANITNEELDEDELLKLIVDRLEEVLQLDSDEEDFQEGEE